MAIKPPAPAPVLVSEHGRGQSTVVKAHHRAPPKKTPPPTPVPAPSTATGVPPRTVPVNPVDAQVAAAQLPAIQQINAASAASAIAAKNQATTTSGYYQALAGLLKNIGPAVQQGYSSAAGADAAFGKGFSDGLAHVQGTTQGEATDMAGISGGTAPAPPTAGASDALYALGGYIPASTMNREGAAFGAAADQLPATAAGQGANLISGIGRQQVVDQQGFTKQLADLAAQVPGLRAQYQTAYDTQQNAIATQKQTARNEAQHEADVRRQQRISLIIATGVGPDGKLTPKAQAELARATGYDPVTGKPTAATVAAQGRLAVAQVNAQTAIDRLTLAQQKALSDMYGHDADGNLTLPGRKAALAEYKATHPAAKGGFTKSQLQKISAAAGTQANNYFNGKTKVVVSNGVATTVTVQNPIADYQTALRQMVSAGTPLTIAQRALNAYWPYGNANQGKIDPVSGNPEPYGRPYLDLQMRDVLTKAWPGHQIDPFRVPTKEEVALLQEHGVSYGGPVDSNAAVPYPPPPK